MSRASACTSADNARLIRTLLDLRDLGKTVLVIEHDEETMRSADWIVYMGPGAGELADTRACSAPTDDFMQCSDSLTARYLTRRVGKSTVPAGLPATRAAADYLEIRGATRAKTT